MPKLPIPGCHREREPAATLAEVKPFLSQVGITRVADVTGLDYPGIPTVMVVRPNARSLSVTQGKGLTLEIAKASGVMEAIEHAHAEEPAIPLLLARLGRVSESVCDVGGLPAFPRAWGALDAETRLLWTEAEDIPAAKVRLVPFEMVHLDFTLPLPEGTGHFPISSNGLASGNSLGEATVHALLELIERDARTCFFLRPQAAWQERRLALETVDDDACATLIERLRCAGLSVAAWDMTTDIDIASVLVGVLEREDNAFRRVPLAYGSGTSSDRRLALLRALTEAAQIRLTNIVGARDDTLPEHLETTKTIERQAEHRCLLREQPATGRSFQSVPHRVFDSFEAELIYACERLQGCGMSQVLRVNLSRQGWPVSVVRMIVPGLEAHIDMPDYRPGNRALRILQGEAW
ncbi:MAG TPA: YcaO-like family protein [Polyangiales bacterium]|nr:YcaO-like family protein [Polyangiales bacterium]